MSKENLEKKVTIRLNSSQLSIIEEIMAEENFATYSSAMRNIIENYITVIKSKDAAESLKENYKEKLKEKEIEIKVYKSMIKEIVENSN